MNKKIEDCNGAEKTVKYQVKNADISFFPLTSISLENAMTV